MQEEEPALLAIVRLAHLVIIILTILGVGLPPRPQEVEMEEQEEMILYLVPVGVLLEVQGEVVEI